MGSDRTKMVVWHWQRHCLCVWRPHYFVSTIVNSTWGYGGVVSHPNWRSWLQSLPGKFCNLTLTRCLKMVFPMLSQNVINSYTNLLHLQKCKFQTRIYIFCQFKWSKSSVLVASVLFLWNSFQNSCNSKETLNTYVIWTDFVIWIDFVIYFWYGSRSSWDIPWYLQSFWQSMTWWTDF